jgi:hypothetical protein
MYSAQGIFQHHFQCKKVHTILDKIWYLIIRLIWDGLAPSFQTVGSLLRFPWPMKPAGKMDLMVEKMEIIILQMLCQNKNKNYQKDT